MSKLINLRPVFGTLFIKLKSWPDSEPLNEPEPWPKLFMKLKSWPLREALNDPDVWPPLPILKLPEALPPFPKFIVPEAPPLICPFGFILKLPPNEPWLPVKLPLAPPLTCPFDPTLTFPFKFTGPALRLPLAPPLTLPFDPTLTLPFSDTGPRLTLPLTPPLTWPLFTLRLPEILSAIRRLDFSELNPEQNGYCMIINRKFTSGLQRGILFSKSNSLKSLDSESVWIGIH